MQMTEKLAACSELTKYDFSGETEAEKLAHAIYDINESIQKISITILPKLESANSPAALVDFLLDFREELNHVIYHVNDSRFLKHLLEHLP